MRWSFGFVGLLAGCAPFVPPPAHPASMSPSSALERGGSATDLMASVIVVDPARYSGSLNHAIALDSGVVVVDAHAQLGQSFAGFGPGLWVRTQGHEHYGAHLGVRIGGTLGTGDLFGWTPFRMPYAGASVHGQCAVGLPKDSGAISVTLGSEWSFPLWPEVSAIEIEDGEGNVELHEPTNASYYSVEGRWDIPVSDKGAIIVGGGVDFMFGQVQLPQFTLGARL